MNILSQETINYIAVGKIALWPSPTLICMNRSYNIDFDKYGSLFTVSVVLGPGFHFYPILNNITYVNSSKLASISPDLTHVGFVTGNLFNISNSNNCTMLQVIVSFRANE